MSPESASGRPDHLFEVLEDDETVPPRPEEEAADVDRGGTAPVTPPPGAGA